MPELPEVQTVVNSLKPKVKNLTISDIVFNWKRVIYNTDQKKFKKLISNNKINNVFRMAKFIVLVCTSSKHCSIDFFMCK